MAVFVSPNKKVLQKFYKKIQKGTKTKVNEVAISIRFINTFHVTTLAVFLINLFCEGNKKGTNSSLFRFSTVLVHLLPLIF